MFNKENDSSSNNKSILKNKTATNNNPVYMNNINNNLNQDPV
jgi:hypothetical protein